MIQSVTGMGAGMMAMQGPKPGGGPEKDFQKVDADGDGLLKADEIQNLSDLLAEKMDTEAQSVEEMLAQLDGDGDGALSFAEFESGRPQGPPPPRGGGPGQMDLSSLFSSSDEELEELEESLYAYA